MLLKQVQAGKLQPEKLATHTFPLSRAMEAYDTFADAAEKRALKVLLQHDQLDHEHRAEGRETFLLLLTRSSFVSPFNSF